jgi:hypothetical protein
MMFKIFFTDGNVATLRANDDLMEDVIKVYGYPHKVGIDRFEICHGDGTHKAFIPE